MPFDTKKFFSGVSSAISELAVPRLEEHRRDEEKQQAELREFYTGALQRGNLTKVQQDAVIGELNKLYKGKESRGLLNKMKEAFGRVGTAQGKVSPQEEAIRGAAGPSVEESGQRKLAEGQAGFEQRKKQAGEFPGLSQREQAEIALQRNLPGGGAPATRQQKAFALPDGSGLYLQWDPKTGTYYDQQNNEIKVPEDAKPMSSSTSNARGVFGSNLVTLKNAKELEKQGMKLTLPDGTPLQVDKLPETMMLNPIQLGGGKLAFLPIDPKYQEHVIGNRSYAATSQGLPDLASGGGTELGVKRAPTSGSSGQITQGPGGEPVMTMRPRTTTPAAPGIPGRTPGQAPLGQPTSAPAPGTPQAKSPGTPGGGPPPAGQIGLPTGAYNQAVNVMRPVMEASNRIFGDPDRPDSNSLVTFGDLADDPKVTERLGRVVQLTYDQLDEASGGKTGNTFMDWAKAETGFNAALASARAKVMQSSMGRLSPRETEYYDSLLASMSTVVGLRSISRAGSSRYNVGMLERELPAIGINVKNSTQYYDKLEQLAGVVKAATKGTEKTGVWAPGDLEHISNLPEQMSTKKKESAAKERVQVRNTKTGEVGSVPRFQLGLAKSKGFEEVKGGK